MTDRKRTLQFGVKQQTLRNVWSTVDSTRTTHAVSSAAGDTISHSVSALQRNATHSLTRQFSLVTSKATTIARAATCGHVEYNLILIFNFSLN